MQTWPIVFILGIIFTIGLAFLLTPSESAIPPTPAFSKVISGGQQMNATNYNSNFTMTSLGDLSTSISGNTLTIRLVQQNCSPGEAFVGIAANGTFICGIP